MKGSHVSSIRKNKGKSKEGEDDFDSEKSKLNCLATMDIFAGCGGLSEGLQQSGIPSPLSIYHPPSSLYIYVHIAARLQAVRYTLLRILY